MQARRAAALVVSCVLGICLVTGAHFGHSANHPGRSVAVLAVSTVDADQHAARHAPDAAAPPIAGWTAPPRLVGGTSDTSQRASVRTAQTPLIRGPPDQGRG